MTSRSSTALLDNTAALLAHGDPWTAVGEAGVRALLEQLAPTPQGQAHFRRFLARVDATWISDADPHLPRQAQRLLRMLRASGFPVVLPACGECGGGQLLTQTLEDGRRVCNTCRKARYTRRCDECDKTRVISHRIEGKSVCGTCRRRQPEAKEACIRCGHDRLVQNRTADGPICPQCAPGKIEPCVHCGRERRVRVKFLGGATCDPCFSIIRGTRRPCPRCGTVGLVASVADDGTLACSACTGVRSRFICAECGVEDIRNGKRCYPCLARIAIDDLFAAGTPARRRALEPLRQRIFEHPEPKSMARWPGRSASAAILCEILTEDIELTHEALDRHPTVQAASLLRHSLVDVGALEPRDTASVQFMAWIDTFLQGRPEHITRTLGPFCRWHVPARIRLFVQRNGITDGTFVRARRVCRIAADFLAHLDTDGIELKTAPQDAVESYLDRYPRNFEPLAVFLRWASQRGIAERIHPVPSPYAIPYTAYPIDTYRAWMHRFATDETIRLRTRICGLLAGISGRPSTTIAGLTTASIIDDTDGMQLRLGATPFQLPPPLPALIRRQLATPRRWDTESTWIFPSKLRAGEHVHASRFTTELQHLNCGLVELRGAALLNLAATMPVAPLCDLTGASPNVAARWQTVAASAYAQYPAIRPRAEPDHSISVRSRANE